MPTKKHIEQGYIPEGWTEEDVKFGKAAATLNKNKMVPKAAASIARKKQREKSKKLGNAMRGAGKMGE